MKAEQYQQRYEFTFAGGGWLPANPNAEELQLFTKVGETRVFNICEPRDLAFHRAYFSLLAYIYKQLPPAFKNAIKPDKFHRYLQHIQGDFNVIFNFPDGSQLVEYESISFGNMTQARFEKHIADMLPTIYGQLLPTFYSDRALAMVIQNIESEYVRFLTNIP